jgi:hypothetical protein
MVEDPSKALHVYTLHFCHHVFYNWRLAEDNYRLPPTAKNVMTKG